MNLCGAVLLLVLGAAEAAGSITVNATGPWTHVYNPSLEEYHPPPPSTTTTDTLAMNNATRWTWYINDHTFVMGPGGEWHLFGITHTDPADPEQEVNLAHAVGSGNSSSSSSATSPSPNQHNLFRLAPFALGAELPETHLWAPYIICLDQTYFMFYCGGGIDRTKSIIGLATSPDLFNWTRHGALFTGGIDGRDPMVLDRGEAFGNVRFVIYYTGTNPNNLVGPWHHVHYCRTSGDLFTWSNATISFDGGADGNNFGGPTESPFVVQRGKHFYLFTGSWYFQYKNTHVFHSLDPLDFGSTVTGTADLVGIIPAHAPEVVRGVDGSWYVTACGWGQGGVFMSELTFSGDNVTDDERMYPPRPLVIPQQKPRFRTNLGSVDTWQSTNFSSIVDPSSQVASHGGSSRYVVPSGLALGDALSDIAVVAQTPLLDSHLSLIACSCSLKLTTQDGNPTSDSVEGRFSTSGGLLLATEAESRNTSSSSRGVLSLNVSVDSHGDDTYQPTVGIVSLMSSSASFSDHRDLVVLSQIFLSWCPQSANTLSLKFEVNTSSGYVRADVGNATIAAYLPPNASSLLSEGLVRPGLWIQHGSGLFDEFYCIVV